MFSVPPCSVAPVVSWSGDSGWGYIYNSYKAKLHYLFLLICKTSTLAVHYHLQLKFTSKRIMIFTSARHIIHYRYNLHDYANKSIHILYDISALPTPYIYISYFLLVNILTYLYSSFVPTATRENTPSY
jgi:hypothetical protein